MKTTKIKTCSPECEPEFAQAIRDTIDFFSGKWKLPILGALMGGKMRFKELERTIPKITPRMLSKELRDLELNKMVKRTVYDTVPASIEYELTPYGKTLDTVLMAMYHWGVEHRKKVIGK